MSQPSNVSSTDIRSPYRPTVSREPRKGGSSLHLPSLARYQVAVFQRLMAHGGVEASPHSEALFSTSFPLVVLREPTTLARTSQPLYTAAMYHHIYSIHHQMCMSIILAKPRPLHLSLSMFARMPHRAKTDRAMKGAVLVQDTGIVYHPSNLGMEAVEQQVRVQFFSASFTTTQASLSTPIRKNCMCLIVILTVGDFAGNHAKYSDDLGATAHINGCLQHMSARYTEYRGGMIIFPQMFMHNRTSIRIQDSGVLLGAKSPEANVDNEDLQNKEIRRRIIDGPATADDVPIELFKQRDRTS
ncbi:hypothetical protein Hypma_012108 [Hypsizygus marmoreus]|uniref:Uncharacterized protein n=1 Tax=Hypsizygus marmoreus TaxID=39966 RepID=A0A369JJZ8_HYPMA|nr:hypothetical protein Hypma_012108 [Hypsizygus marmoreus]